jgi:Heparinase II/III-like protein
MQPTSIQNLDRAAVGMDDTRSTEKGMTPTIFSRTTKLSLSCAIWGGLFLFLSAIQVSVAAAGSSPLRPERIEQISAMLGERPAGFGAPCSNRQAWVPLKSRFAPQVSQAAAILAEPIVPWDNDAYLDFSRSGNRVRGEALLKARQDPLSPLVLAECIEAKGRFVTRIAHLVDSLSQEPSWTLPASDAQLDSFSGRRHFVDLNAAILANTIAETLYLLGDSLPGTTKENAMRALGLHIFSPMREAYTAGSGEQFLELENNWNAVCLNGVTGAALTVLPNRNDRALFVAGAEQYYTNYLKSFPDDGYAVEGIGYWNYGMVSFTGLREHVWQSTGGQIDFFHDPIVRAVALFGLQFQMLPGVYADFGDAKFGDKPSSQLIAYLEDVFGILDPNTHKPVGGVETMPKSGELVSDVMASFPIRSQLPASSGQDFMGSHTYYPIAKVLVLRPADDEKLGITVKAGGNGNHSHNDIGSFSVALGDSQLLGDPGGPNFYTAATFSNQRFESPLLNSYGHPVPFIDGHLQLDATKVNARIVQTSFEPGADSITIDMTSAYDVPGLEHVDRTVSYSRQGAGTIEVIDTFVLKKALDVEESLPTHGTWKQVGSNTIDFTTKSQALTVSVSAPYPTIIGSRQISEYGNTFTRVGVLVKMQSSGKIAMHISPRLSQ